MSTSAPRRSTRPPELVPPDSWISDTDGVVPSVSVAWISRPRSGEVLNGDAVVVRRIGGTVLVALIDALGHGPKAAEVARTSVAWLSDASEGEALDLVHGLHKALQGSRGAAALVLTVSASGLDACSVGNVELRSSNNRLPFVLTPGVLGVRLRQPKICSSRLPITDRMVLYSDGISGRFDLRSFRSHSPSELATHIFGSHRHVHDDATVVVVDLA